MVSTSAVSGNGAVVYVQCSVQLLANKFTEEEFLW